MIIARCVDTGQVVPYTGCASNAYKRFLAHCCKIRTICRDGAEDNGLFLYKTVCNQNQQWDVTFHCIALFPSSIHFLYAYFTETVFMLMLGTANKTRVGQLNGSNTQQLATDADHQLLVPGFIPGNRQSPLSQRTRGKDAREVNCAACHQPITEDQRRRTVPESDHHELEKMHLNCFRGFERPGVCIDCLRRSSKYWMRAKKPDGTIEGHRCEQCCRNFHRNQHNINHAPCRACGTTTANRWVFGHEPGITICSACYERERQELQLTNPGGPCIDCHRIFTRHWYPVVDSTDEVVNQIVDHSTYEDDVVSKTQKH